MAIRTQIKIWKKQQQYKLTIIIGTICYNHTLQWRHNGCDGLSNHQPRDYLLNRLFRRRSKNASKHRLTGLCEGNSPVTGEFPTQRASNTENVSIWCRHHAMPLFPWIMNNHERRISSRKCLQIAHKNAQWITRAVIKCLWKAYCRYGILIFYVRL